MLYYIFYTLHIYIHMFTYIWVNYNDLTATEPWESWVKKENYLQMELI